MKYLWQSPSIEPLVQQKLWGIHTVAALPRNDLAIFCDAILYHTFLPPMSVNINPYILNFSIRAGKVQWYEWDRIAILWLLWYSIETKNQAIGDFFVNAQWSE